jgi:hypothetical protein
MFKDKNTKCCSASTPIEKPCDGLEPPKVILEQ